MYQPKIIKGRVKGTGWAIDGHVLYFSLWGYDRYSSYHLHDWEDADDEAVMQTMFQTEREAGFCCHDTLESFAEAWKAGTWDPLGVFCIDLDKVEELEVVQEEARQE